jgi:hypothetical protein
MIKDDHVSHDRIPQKKKCNNFNQVRYSENQPFI